MTIPKRIGIYWKWLNPNLSSEFDLVEFRFHSEDLKGLDDPIYPPIQIQMGFLTELQLSLGEIGFIPTLHGPTDDNEYSLPTRKEMEIRAQAVQEYPMRGCLIALIVMGIAFLLGALIF